ncbi:MAG: hypothetical protein ACJZ59_06940 [Candidatus Thalassarchaeaceae archaeon]
MALWNASNHGWDWSIALGGTNHDDYLYDVRFVGNGSIAGVGQKSGVVSVGLTTLSNAGTGYVAMASDQGTWSWAQQPVGQIRGYEQSFQRVMAASRLLVNYSTIATYEHSASILYDRLMG